jgi:predicted MFS family arabinose efflux permease
MASACRLLLNTARRFGYTYAPVIGRGLGVPLTSVTALLAINQATGLIGLAFGPLADRWGYRRMMLAGLTLLALGMGCGAWWPVYGSVLGGLLLAGLGKNLFDPALQAYVAARVPFGRRGRIMGLLETSWAGSTLLGIPALGLLIHTWGWRAPFAALSLAGLAALAGLGRLLPREERRQTAPGLIFPPPAADWRRFRPQPAVFGALGFMFCISAANDSLFVVYGAWLESVHHLGTAALGAGTGLIGVAELLGEFATAVLADRMGLRRAVFRGALLMALSCALLPVAGGHLTGALAALCAVFISMEFTVVSTLSLCTELAPAARATMMATLFAAAGLGRVVGAMIGGPLWLAAGMIGIGALSAGLSLLGMAGLAWGLRRWQPHADAMP